MTRLLPILLLLTATASAQTPGSCQVGRANGTLRVSQVQATAFTTGTLFYGPGGAGEYYVPQSSQLSPMYASSIWASGQVGGELRVAGATYGQGGVNNEYFEFWPGPLNDDATLPNPSDCSSFDRIWVVSKQDILAYEAGGWPANDLAGWPVSLGAPAVDGSGQPLPADRSSLNLAAGDRPALSGDQTAFWVLNDVGNEHRATGSEPLGIEVAVTAFAVASEIPALSQSTFYRYRIINRNTQPIEDARVSFWADPDLGNAGDDFVGSDTTRSMVYVYNADEVDDGEYGSSPPALGVDVLGGEAHQAPSLSASAFLVSADSNRGDPHTAVAYDRVMRGVWSDGTPMTDRGNGYTDEGGQPVRFAFPGDPVTQSAWSEENNGIGRNVPNDRRFVLSSELGTLAPGASATVDYAIIYARGSDRLDSITQLRAASDLIQAAYDDGDLFLPFNSPGGSTPTEADADSGALTLSAFPNPIADRTTLRYHVPEAGAVTVAVTDVLGRRVAILADGLRSPGERTVTLDAAALAAGVYVVVLESPQGRVARTITVAR